MAEIPYHDHKDPGEIKDYSVDFSGDLPAGDTIATVNWVAPAGITEGDSSLAGAIATIELSGGVAGTAYRIAAEATTAGGFVLTAAFWVPVVDKYER